MTILDPCLIEATDPVVEPKFTSTPGLFAAVWRVISSFPALIGALIVAGVYWKCSHDFADPDIWWHLRNAQHLFQTWHLPNFDTYSFSAAGSPWLNHEWLSEAFYYLSFNALGFRGIYLLYATLSGLLMLIAYSLAFKESGDPLSAAVTTVVGALLATVGFGPRTQHFGWLCFLGMFSILLRFRSGRKAPLWVIPVLFCVWINCHGGWLIGLMIFGIFVIAGLMPRHIGRIEANPWTATQLKKLCIAFFASGLGLLINPFGYRLVTYPFDMMFRQKLNIAVVEEWSSVNFNNFRGKIVALVFAAIFLLVLTSRKRWRVDDVLLTAFVVYCGLSHIRFLLLTGIVLPPILTPYCKGLSTYKAGQDRRVLNAALIVILTAILLYKMPRRQMLDTQISDFFPVRAVTYLRTHPEEGKLFNVYHWGGYLEWHLPQTKTFIDSRTDIFEYNGTLKDYFDIIQLANSQELLDRHEISYVLYPADASLPYFLSQSSKWKLVYGDNQAVIYCRVRT